MNTLKGETGSKSDQIDLGLAGYTRLNDVGFYKANISTLHTRWFYNNKLVPSCYNTQNFALWQLVPFYFLVKLISKKWVEFSFM